MGKFSIAALKQNSLEYASNLVAEHDCEELLEDLQAEYIANYLQALADPQSKAQASVIANFMAMKFLHKQLLWKSKRKKLDDVVAPKHKELTTARYCALKLAMLLSQMARHECCFCSAHTYSKKTIYFIYRDAVIDGIIGSDLLTTRWNIGPMSAALIHEHLRMNLLPAFAEGYVRWNDLLPMIPFAADTFCFELGLLPYFDRYDASAVYYEKFDACIHLDRFCKPEEYEKLSKTIKARADKESLKKLTEEQREAYLKNQYAKETHMLEQKRKKQKRVDTDWAQPGSWAQKYTRGTCRGFAETYIAEVYVLSRESKEQERLLTLRRARVAQNNIPLGWIRENVKPKFRHHVNIAV